MTGALLLAVVVGLAHSQPDSVASQAASAVGEAAVRAVAFARGVPRTDNSTTEALNPKVVRQTAAHTGSPAGPVAPGETTTVPVLIRNQGEDTWETAGAHAVTLAYHLYDGGGQVVTWDGVRSALPSDVAPGAEATVPLRLAAPPMTGVYTVKPDLIREGQAWFSSTGAAPGSFSLRVTTELDASYGPTTAPASIVPGGDATIEVHIANTGLSTWPAGGEHPVRLSYHWLDGTPSPVMWDGGRAILPHDVKPGEELALLVSVRAPAPR